MSVEGLTSIGSFPRDEKEKPPPPFTFARVFPQENTRADHITAIRSFDDPWLETIYSDGLRLEKENANLHNEVRENKQCADEITEARRLKRQMDAIGDYRSTKNLDQYRRAERNKKLFACSIGIGIPALAGIAGWGFYMRHKEKQEKKQLQELLQVAASSEATTPGPTSPGAISNSR